MQQMTDFKIEKIALTRRPKGPNRKYPLRDLAPGESFYVPKGPDGEDANRAVSSARFFRAKTGRDITWKRDSGGVRIGRTATDSDEAAARRLRAQLRDKS